ncbi:MAG: TonB-dependent receptor [Bacteroidales bacterium]|nr:TonB-dependent receptor [Bacteroidales bacterium]
MKFVSTYMTLLSLLFLSLVVHAQVIGKVDADTVLVDHELQNINVVGQKGRESFQSVDASAALNTAGVGGGIEGVVKSQMGVTSNSELSSQYRVRGGNFDENLVYVNNIEVFKPMLIRSGEQEGLSFVNPDMVDRVNFSSGGFNVSFADKMSSVLDVKYKVPREWHASARASLLGASAHVEGKAGQLYSQITGVRYKTNKYVLGSMDTKGEYDPTFLDVQSLHNFNFSSNVRLNLLGYYASNKYDFVPKNRETTFGTMADARKFTIYFDGNEADRYKTGMFAGSLLVSPLQEHTFYINASHYRSNEQENYDVLGEYWLQQAGDSETNIGVGGYMEHARNELLSIISTVALRGTDYVGTHKWTPRGTSITPHRLTWELKLQHEHFDDYMNEWSYSDSAGYMASPDNGLIRMDRYVYSDNKLDTRRLMAFLMDEIDFYSGDNHYELCYGVRVSNNNVGNDNGVSETIVSPRLSFSMSHDRWQHRISGGLYSQSPMLRELRRNDGTLNTDVKAQRSWQIVIGNDLYFEAGDGERRPFKFTVEAYYKNFSRLNPYSIENVRIRYMASNCAKGYAYGIDAKINGELVEGVESWACLSFMKTAEDIEGDGHGWIARPSDQRVNFSMMFNDYIPTNKSMGANLNFVFGSGLPFGPPNSQRYKQTSRMPGYKRVDLGLFKDFAKNKEGKQKWEVVKSARLGVEVLNLFDSNNTISHFWVNDVNYNYSEGKGGQYAVPNYLTSRRINVKLSFEM